MQHAVILAAGQGSRMLPLTRDTPKTMVQVCGESFISRILKCLVGHNFTVATIVVGFERDKLVDFVNDLALPLDVKFITNRQYETTNSLYSLNLALKEQTAPFVLFEADIVFDPSLLDRLLKDPASTATLLEGSAGDPPGTIAYVRDGTVTAISHESDRPSPDSQRAAGHKTLNITKYATAAAVQTMKNATTLTLENEGCNVPLEQALKTFLTLDGQIRGVMTHQEIWAEIDTEEELAEFQHSVPECAEFLA